MSEHGVAILMSTHTLEVAQEMCDRISIILKGRIIARGTVDELRALAGGRRATTTQLTAVFLKLTGGRAAGDRRDRLSMAPAVSVPAAADGLGVAQPRAPARAGRLLRGVALRRRSALLVFAAVLWGCVLAHLAALDVRGARRLPAAARAVVAVPHVSLLPRLQRHRHRALDVLPVGGSAAAAGGAGRAAPAVLRALRADGRPGVVDGGGVPRPRPGRRRPRALRRPCSST